MGKGGSQTIGFKYSMSVLMGIGRTVSELVEIKVGAKTAWKGPACDHNDQGQVIRIDKPNLFGGDKKEGGIQGPARILWGGPKQKVDAPLYNWTSKLFLPNLKEIISNLSGAKVPDLRGVTTLWYNGEVCSISPYPKEWQFRVRRHIHGWYDDKPWYPAKAVIYLTAPELLTYKEAVSAGDVIAALFLGKGGSSKNDAMVRVPGNIKAMNPAHIVYECITNPEWGRGQPRELIDENSFIYGANLHCDEGFGLCFYWQREEDVDVFIKTVCEHVGSEVYTDRSTGLLTYRAIRDDYKVEDLPTFEPGRGLIDILSDDSSSQDVAYNEVIIKYHDPVTNTDGEARAHNAGARAAQGTTNTLTKELPGIPTKELAARVALRELIVQTGLKKYRVRLDRSGWRIAPGMPFRVKCPERGIGSIILRAGEVRDSSAQQGGDIQIDAIEDTFSMPLTGMVVPEDSAWTPPATDAVAPDASLAFEMSYYDLFKHVGQFQLPGVTDDDAFFALVASQPTPTQLEYELMVDADGAGYKNRGTFPFTPNAKLVEPLLPLDTSCKLEAIEYWPDDIIRDSMIIGNERVRIDAFDMATGVMTITRGVADTLPSAHPAGTFIWLPDDDLGSDQIVYAPGETIKVAAATLASQSVLLAEDYDPQEVTIRGRVGRPYPPAGLKIDGESVYLLGSKPHPTPVLTWTTRNRLTQQDQLVGHEEASVAPEEGTTFEVEVFDNDDKLLSTYKVDTATTFTYGAVEQAADGDPKRVRFNVVAVRGDQRSLYGYDQTVVISGGWGYSWGNNWS